MDITITRTIAAATAAAISRERRAVREDVLTADRAVTDFPFESSAHLPAIAVAILSAAIEAVTIIEVALQLGPDGDADGTNLVREVCEHLRILNSYLNEFVVNADYAGGSVEATINRLALHGTSLLRMAQTGLEAIECLSGVMVVEGEAQRREDG